MFAPLDEILARAHVVRLTMNVKFRGVTTREMVLFRGPRGWAEFGPFGEYDDEESVSWLQAALEWGWESAPAPLRAHIPVNATLPAVSADLVASVLERFGDLGGSSGFGETATVKVKVAENGQSLDEDIARVRRVREIAPKAKIRIDANAGWGERDALEALSALAEFSLEYAEQPVATVEGLARLREALAARDIPLLIAADESVRKAEDPLRVARLGAADLLVVKVAPLGGVQRALRVVKESGLPCVVSSALDSSVGIAAGVALAAALPKLDYACGLGTVALFNEDVATPSLVPKNGLLSVADSDNVHTGDTVRPDALSQFYAGREREKWWLERITRCYALLESQEGRPV